MQLTEKSSPPVRDQQPGSLPKRCRRSRRVVLAHPAPIRDAIPRLRGATELAEAGFCMTVFVEVLLDHHAHHLRCLHMVEKLTHRKLPNATWCLWLDT